MASFTGSFFFFFFRRANSGLLFPSLFFYCIGAASIAVNKKRVRRVSKEGREGHSEKGEGQMTDEGERRRRKRVKKDVR